MRTFTFSDATSHKFWNIERKGKSFTVTYGKIGSNGQTQVKEFADDARARKEHDKLVAEKVKKGYKEITPSPTSAAPPSPLVGALEESLVSQPQDRAAHSAYADYLILRDVRASNGTAVAVSDEAMRRASDEIGSAEGLFVAPEGAAAWAAVQKLAESGGLDRSSRIVLFNTGSGFKYVE